MSADKPAILVLVVDDEPTILSLMQEILEPEGYQVVTATNGESALRLLQANPPALLLLDLRLPDIDGYTLCQRIRSFSQLPIIMVTGKDKTIEMVDGLRVGADDYIRKPFVNEELVARIAACLRRSQYGINPVSREAFQLQHLKIDFVSGMVTLRDQPVDLTATEYRLLVLLARNAGQILTPQEILERLWGANDAKDGHLIQVNISRLRQKLHDAGKSRYIQTVIGRGYLMKKA